MPDDLKTVETVDFKIVWEVSYEDADRDEINRNSFSELNQLFERKLLSIIDEKNADIARVTKETVKHSVRYDPYSSYTTGEYVAILYCIDK